MRKALLTALAATAIASAAAYDGDRSEWMKHIPGSAYACLVTIPGSHDSATAEGWVDPDAAARSQAQDVTLDRQLADGVRGFDIRPNLTDGRWVCSHAADNTVLPLDDCFDKFTRFLDAHPSEYLVIHIYRGGGREWTDTEREAFARFLSLYADRLADFRRDLTVDDLRGKILLFCREEYPGTVYGAKLTSSLRDDYGWGSWLDWDRQTNITATGNSAEGRVFYQDLADTCGEGKQQEKLDGIRHLLDFTTAYRPAVPENCIWYFNFASAYNDADVTSTGSKMWNSDGYRGNSTYTNPCFIDYLAANPGPAGIVLADYVCTNSSGRFTTRGADLIEALIDNNFRYLPSLKEETARQRGGGLPTRAQPVVGPSPAAPAPPCPAAPKPAPAPHIHPPQRSPPARSRFVEGAPLTLPPGTVHIADLNNDGYPDLLVTGPRTGHIYLSDQGRGFIDATPTQLRFYTADPATVSLVDCNADGYPDLYIAPTANTNPENDLGNKAIIYYNNQSLTGPLDIFNSPDLAP